MKINLEIILQEKSSINIQESIQILKERMKKIDKTILNRRKKKLEEMLNDSKNNYFSEEEIKMRDPILYEIYVGQHKRNCRIFNLNVDFIDGNEQSSVTKFLMNELESEIHKDNLKKEIMKEANKYGDENINMAYKELEIVNFKVNNLLEDEEDELIRLMSVRFLMGEDKDFFNYEEVDNNENYDDLEQMNKDSEEAYFEEEEANLINNGEYTGEQDY